MFDNKLVLVIVVTIGIVGVVAFLNNGAKETFWNIPSRQWQVQKLFSNTAAPLYDPARRDFFQSPNFQSILSPRFSNVNYGANLQTQFPAYNRMGVPEDPLSNRVRNGNTSYSDYTGGYGFDRKKNDEQKYFRYVNGGDESCNVAYEAFQDPLAFSTIDKNGDLGSATNVEGLGYHQPGSAIKFAPPLPLDPHNSFSSAYANGNYYGVVDDVMKAGGGPLPTDTLLEGVGEPFMNENGEMKQPIVYDRFIFSNRRSRLRSQGDPIRGDLPVVPIAGDWFRPSVYPNIDLQAGAINVLAGVNNETNNQLANLIYNSSGGGETAIGGVDMRGVNMSHRVFGAAAAAQGDVQMTAFP